MAKARTVQHKDHPIDPSYDGLRRALEETFELHGKHQLTLADHRKINAEGTLFRFHLKPDTLSKLKPPITEGWIVEAAPGSPRARVVLVDEDEDRLIVRVGGTGRSYRFAKQLWFTAPDYLRRLREWIADCLGRGEPLLLKQLRACAPAIEHLQIPQAAESALRPAQKHAVAHSSEGLRHLWGPPGTGKTFTLAKIVQSLVAREYKVAYLAPTNIAVDTGLLAIHRAFTDTEPVPGGYLLRAGYPQLTELDHHPELLAWQAALKQSQQEIRRLERTIKDIDSCLTAADRAESEKLELQKAEHKEDLQRTKTERGETLWRLAREAQVMATTTYSALTREEMVAFLEAPKVAVIIDEAGMVPRYTVLPLLELMGGGHGLQARTLQAPPKEVVLIYGGDPKQLAPIHRQTNEKDVNLRYWMGESLMEELLTEQPEGPTPNRSFLTQQSRMDITICRRISRTYYKGQLTTLPDAARPRPPLCENWPEDGVVIVDPDLLPVPMNAPEPKFLDRERCLDERRIWVAVKLIKAALESGKAKSVLWLTPFRKQAIRARFFCDSQLSNLTVRVGTVHTSQGGEADLVIFDPVNPAHPWLKGKMGQEIDIERLLNVAVSRGRGQVIVFATRRELSKNDIFRRLLWDATEWRPG